MCQLFASISKFETVSVVNRAEKVKQLSFEHNEGTFRSGVAVFEFVKKQQSISFQLDPKLIVIKVCSAKSDVHCDPPLKVSLSSQRSRNPIFSFIKTSSFLLTGSHDYQLFFNLFFSSTGSGNFN